MTATVLRDATTRAETAETSLEGARATIALRDGEIARIVAENTKLLADKAARDEADLRADVEAAFVTYRDERKLTDKDKDAMTRVAKADRAAFNALYPPVSLEHRFLLRQVTPREPRVGAEDLAPSFEERVRRIMSERNCSRSEAQNIASEGG